MRKAALLVFVFTTACGQAGSAGPKGEQGEPGTPGAKGESGPKGEPGTAGVAGSKGDPGTAGATGVQGPTGAEGPQGIQGPPGAMGPQGVPGPAGSAGPQGPRGPAGGGVVWKDATGATVRMFNYGLSPEAFVFDDRGLIWYTALVINSTRPGYRAGAVYESANCTGTAFIQGTDLPPRFVFEYTIDGSLRVLPDDIALDLRTMNSRRDDAGGPCYGGPGSTRVVPAASTLPSVPIVVPTRLVTPPVHPEWQGE